MIETVKRLDAPAKKQETRVRLFVDNFHELRRSGFGLMLSLYARTMHRLLDGVYANILVEAATLARKKNSLV
jgi:hypothetical protein